MRSKTHMNHRITLKIRVEDISSLYSSMYRTLSTSHSRSMYRSLSLFLIFFCLTVLTKQQDMANQNLKVCTWNMNNRFGAGQPYLHELLNSSTICVINEHGLYPNELYKLKHIHQDFNAFGKASKDLKDSDFGDKFGHCGCAIMWRNSINNYVVPRIELGSDRICVLQIKIPNCIDVVVIGVYLPYYGCKIASFPEELGIVEDLIIQFNSTCTVLIVGDINAHICVNSYRSWGVSSQNGKLFNYSMNKHDMIIADLL